MPNRLANESSAYLLQHRHNPVDWYPWGDEPFARARDEDRPVLVSIGYSSCHWCHVMERESFEDADVARLMNEQLVCIKVDREERPDVDQIYMDALVRLSGQGGWPLNVFCQPDGKPFFGGTYFPPERMYGRPSWPDVVRAVGRVYAENRDQVAAQASEVLRVLTERPELGAAPLPGVHALGELCARLMESADTQHGGFGDAPKFPTPTNLEALLAAHALGVATPGAFDHVLLTLRRMARGGIYDQLGGGFHRYSTDHRWGVPHFEKMLYDQGQLLRVYAEALRQSGDPELAWPIEETVAYLAREMRDTAGGLFASQDADSEGEEGRFYVFDRDEVRAVLGTEPGDAFCDAHAITAGGTFESSGKSVLEHALAGPRSRFAEARERLLAARAERVAPDVDTKRVAAWIGYAIGGLATSAAALDRADWLAAATQTADFVWDQMAGGTGDLRRIFDGERARIAGFLDDHAALLCGLLDLLRAGGPARALERAVVIAERTIARFFHPGSGRIYFTAADQRDGGALVYRPETDTDGATPSSAGLAALGLVRLASITGRSDFRACAEAILRCYAPLAARAPHAFPTLVRAGALHEAGPGLGLILGKADAPETRRLAARARELLGSEEAVVVLAPDAAPPAALDAAWHQGREPKGGRSTAYLCRGTTCSLPATRPDDLAPPPRS